MKTKSKYKIDDLLYLEWKDHLSQKGDGWLYLDEIDSQPVVNILTAITVGFLVKETKDSYIIAQNKASNGSYAMFMNILKGEVIKVRKIK